jgi:hypothetical protein
MKSVRLAVGAAGLAPALGLIMPNMPVAEAHTAAPTTKAGSKTVALPYRQTAPAITPCVGSQQQTLHAKGQYGYTSLAVHWWTTYLDGTSRCVGTVKGSWSGFDQTPNWHFRVRIYTNGVQVASKETGLTCHNIFCHASLGFHKYYHDHISICAAWLAPKSFPTKKTVYMCHSVPNNL